jgi:hypothetical protein
VVRGGLHAKRWIVSSVGRHVKCNKRRERYAGGDESVSGGHVSCSDRSGSSEWRTDGVR